MKLTVEQFIEAGYKRWNQDCLNGCDFLLQKKIEDEEGIRYFINIYVFEHYKQSYYREGFTKIGFQPEVQFSEGKYSTIDMLLHTDEMTDIQEIEETFENMWISLGCPYYEKFGE